MLEVARSRIRSKEILSSLSQRSAIRKEGIELSQCSDCSILSLQIIILYNMSHRS